MTKEKGKKKKVAVAMSGGVDSGVAAALLVEQGCDVVGFFMHLWSGGSLRSPDSHGFENGFTRMLAKKWENKCCSLESLEAARRTAHKLKIPFYTVDFREDFKRLVVDYFLDEYARGRTPNPCIVCNKFIKFSKLLEYAKALGCGYLATGHYARIHPSGGVLSLPIRYHLLAAKDKEKDQSYFLYTLTQEQLEHVLYPVGNLLKSKVWEIAKRRKLPVAERPESFEICFVPGDDYRKFLARWIPEAIRPGPIVDTAGEVVGRHKGLPFYTIGQRKGLKISSSVPLYVIRIDSSKNELVVGRGEESERKSFLVEGVNWIDPLLVTRYPLSVQIKIRHQGELLPGVVKWSNGRMAKVELEEPVRGVTPGQSAVFYRGRETGDWRSEESFEVLGGGVIKKSNIENYRK